MSRFAVLLVLLAVAYAAADDEPKKCPANAVWNVCGTLCQPTCSDPKPNPLFCPAIECTPNFTGGCRCAEGYVKSDSKGCVLLKDC